MDAEEDDGRNQQQKEIEAAAHVADVEQGAARGRINEAGVEAFAGFRRPRSMAISQRGVASKRWSKIMGFLTTQLLGEETSVLYWITRRRSPEVLRRSALIFFGTRD
jgi:hypothetical protein